MNEVKSLKPIVSKMSKALILGSMPGEESLKLGKYYAHPRNAFWRIMGELFEAGPSLPYEERVARLQSAGVAVSDTLQTCVRSGSLDTSITKEVPNDFAAFFAEYPNITHVFFNGGKAEEVFRRRVLPALPKARHVFARLPSTSPANASVTLADKVKKWSALRKVLS